jgi:hypothetical protein
MMWVASGQRVMHRSERERRLRIFETNYGRDAGWFVEDHGRRIAQLTDPRITEMFWVSYRIEPLIDDPIEREELLNSPERWDACEFVYRSREFGQVAEYAFPAARPFPESGRVLIRGLYLGIREPSLWERLPCGRGGVGRRPGMPDKACRRTRPCSRRTRGEAVCEMPSGGTGIGPIGTP